MAASTIKTNARGWREVSTTARWTARCVWDTGTALYAVVQDTGATPKVRVMKADSRTAPTTWTEQDSADNKAIANVDYPFSSWLHTNGDLHIIVLTATNTLTHYLFDTDTDQWATGNGTITTDCENEHNVRCCVRSDGDILAFFTANSDDIDLGYFIWQGANWSTGSVTGILTATGAVASGINDAGIDSTDRAWVVFYAADATDISYRTINSANTVATTVDIETGGRAEASTQTGTRFNLYVDGSTDKIIAAYIETGGTLQEREVTLESDANSANLATEATIEATTTDVGARTPISTAVIGGVPYAAWWDDASSGTIKYSTKSAGSWATETNWKTSITSLIEIVPVGTDGLAGVYQSSSDVMFDWILTPSGGGAASLTVTAAEAPAAGGDVTLDAASLFTVTEAAAPAAGGAVTLTGQGRIAVTEAASPAAGGTVNLAAAALFTVTPAAAPAAGGTVALTGQGALAVTAATAPAAGGDVTLDAAANLTVTPATAPAAGGDVLLSAAAAGALEVTTATAPAAADGALTGQGALAVTAATAPSAAAGAMVAAGTMTATPATAPAAGGNVALSAGGAASLSVDAATAPAAADVALTAAAKLTVTPATAPAAGGAVILGASGTMAVTPAAAPAASFGAFVAAARLVVVAAPAPAEGGAVGLGAGEAAALTAGAATASAAAFSALTGASLFAVIAAPAAAASDGAFAAASSLSVIAATATAAADGDLVEPILYPPPIVIFDASAPANAFASTAPTNAYDARPLVAAFDLEE